MNSDPISDFLTRIRNASMVSKPSVLVPHSKFKLELSKLLKNNGGLGTVVVSTSRGLLPDSEARKRKLGEELICEVWS